jgi:hypothetical protein
MPAPYGGGCCPIPPFGRFGSNIEGGAATGCGARSGIAGVSRPLPLSWRKPAAATRAITFWTASTVLLETTRALPVYVCAVSSPRRVPALVSHWMAAGGGADGAPSMVGDADGWGVAREMYRFDALVIPLVSRFVPRVMPVLKARVSARTQGTSRPRT